MLLPKYDFWVFPRKDHADPPPPNVTKLFTGLLQPTFQKGTGSFVSGGPYGPEGEPPPPSVTKIFILDFNCQPLGRVPICFMSVGPYGPGTQCFRYKGNLTVLARVPLILE